MQTIVANVPLFALIGVWESVALLAVVLILFEGPRLPGIGRGFRWGMREFDKGASEAGKDIGGIYGKLAAEALTPDNQPAERYDPRAWRPKRRYEKRASREWWWGHLWRQICRGFVKLLSSKAPWFWRLPIEVGRFWGQV